MQETFLYSFPISLSSCKKLVHTECLASENVCIVLQLVQLSITFGDDKLNLSGVPNHFALLFLFSSFFGLLLCFFN